MEWVLRIKLVLFSKHIIVSVPESKVKYTVFYDACYARLILSQFRVFTFFFVKKKKLAYLFIITYTG